MKRAKELAYTVVAIGFLLSGCATMMSGKTQQLSVNSNVQGARVYLGGERIGNTPLVIDLERGRKGPLVVKAEGYQDYTFAINNKIVGAFWGNVIFGGLPGSVTDAASGSMYEYEPGVFHAELSPLSSSREEMDKSDKIATLRRFLLMNHAAIVRQVAMGEGTHLETLYGALEIADDQRGEHLALWRQHYQNATTAADFASSFIESVEL